MSPLPLILENPIGQHTFIHHLQVISRNPDGCAMYSGDLWNNLAYSGEMKNVMTFMAHHGMQWFQWSEVIWGSWNKSIR